MLYLQAKGLDATKLYVSHIQVNHAPKQEEEPTELTVELTSTNLLHLTLNWLSPKRKKLSPRPLKRSLSDCLPDKEVELLLKSVLLLK